MTPAQKKLLITKSKLLPVLLQVGKNGLSEEFKQEFMLLASKKGLLKIRFLHNFSDTQDTTQALKTLAQDCKVELVHTIGNTAVFYDAKAQVK